MKCHLSKNSGSRSIFHSIVSGAAIAVFVLATAGLGAEERGLQVTAKSLGGDYAVIGRQIAVMVAVDRYKEWLPLKKPVSDAREIAAILKQRYYIDEIIELYNEDATKAGIMRLFERLIAEVKSDDSVLIYYAGHGHLDTITETGFWIPQDAGTEKYEQLNWIPNTQLRSVIGKMKARHVALISDSCFSGDILNPSRGSTPTIDDAYFKAAFSRVSRQVLTSGASETVPDESPFARQLKLALEGNNQPYLDPLMIFTQVRLGVSGTTPLYGSIRDAGHQDGGSFLFFLKDGATASGAKAAAAAPPVVAAKSAPVFGELMVSASVPGADIYVDGSLKGKSPALIQNLPAGQALKVEARTADQAAVMEVTLAAKELREIKLTLTRLKGNVYIESGEKTVRLLMDGTDLGPLGTGIFREIPAGDHHFQLSGDGLYWESRSTVPGDGTLRLSAAPYAVGALKITAPADAAVTILYNGAVAAAFDGSATVDHLKTGAYEIRVSGSGYIDIRKPITVYKAELASFTAYTDGQLAINVKPINIDAVLFLDGKAQNIASLPSATLNLAPGIHELELRAPGYRATRQTISIAAGKKTTAALNLERLAAASLQIDELPFGCTVTAGSATTAYKSPGQSARLEVAAGLPAALSYNVPSALKLDDAYSTATITLAEGESRRLNLPTGKLSVHWLPTGTTLALKAGGAKTALPLSSTGSGFITPPLASGDYQVVLEGPYQGVIPVTVKLGTTIELPAYRDLLRSGLGAEKATAAAKISGAKGLGTAAWVSLGTGILGAAGAGAAYFLGTEAYAAYKAAGDSAAAAAARSNIDLWGAAFVGAAAVGGTGLGLGSILFLATPNTAKLEASIKALDEQIGKLGK